MKKIYILALIVLLIISCVLVPILINAFEEKEPIINQNSNGESLSSNSKFIEESKKTEQSQEIEQSQEEVSEYIPNPDFLNPDFKKNIIASDEPYFEATAFMDISNRIHYSSSILSNANKYKEDENTLLCIKFYVAVKIENHQNKTTTQADMEISDKINNYFAKYGIDYNNYISCGMGQRYVGTKEKPFYLTGEQILAFEKELDMGIIIMYADMHESYGYGYMNLQYPSIP